MNEPVLVDDLDAALEDYKARGYRLEMIFPADDPREAVVSEPPAVAGGLTRSRAQQEACRSIRLIRDKAKVQPPAIAGGSEWIRGRAGMEYRDLIPDRLGGKVVASHIRLSQGGLVPDYVHYHKIDLQLIYCLKGRIRVVYEDQGEPFWLERGDLILQPPEIRHRVLECTAGAEVIEITSPAEHETWVEHEMTLPNGSNQTSTFGGRRFFRHKFRENDARDTDEQHLVDLANGIANALTEADVLSVVATFSLSLCQE